MDKVGAYCTSINPQLWTTQHEMLQKNDTEVELLCVGPNPPSFKLPPGLKYIHATVKPAQCSYIGATRVDGNYVVSITDDVTLCPGAVDTCISVLKKHDQTNTLVCPRYTGHGMGFYSNDTQYPGVPNLTVAHFSSRRLWELYKVDKNFIALYWDMDQCMNVLANGGQAIICDEVTVTDALIDNGSRLSSYNYHYDVKYFQWLWVTDNSAVNLGPGPQVFYGKFEEDKRWWPHLKRAVPLDPIIESADLYTVSQGNKGHWS